MAARWATDIFERHKHERISEFTYNYVDRVRLAENSLQDHKHPSRGSGWRHNKSISHLDLATSCPLAANGLNHWSQTRQLRHARSLDYNHLDRCKDALDAAEFYWHFDPELENYDEVPALKSALNYNDDYYRDYGYADENYHSTNSIYQQRAPATATDDLGPLPPPYDFGSESCSLRRSRSLAVIREETFSDLQITSANSSRRRSQLIPRARLVNRGFFRERERLLCGSNNNNKYYAHHHTLREKLAASGNCAGAADTELHANGSSVGNSSDSQPQLQQQQQQQQQPHRHHHHHFQSRETDDYYENLKRLDALAVGIAEQLQPWHNDKSDLESLNSDYFKNSLHQSQEPKQQLDLEALEQAVNLLTNEKPRIYQSKRQQRSHTERLNATQHKLHASLANSGNDSCPENSQSSVFPETTTSNSDDQTDSASFSEQEYDLKKIEEIFKRTHIEGDDGYELISLTTTTRTRIETTEDEEDDLFRHEQVEKITSEEYSSEHTTTDTEIRIDIEERGALKRAKALSENLEKLISYDSVYLSSEDGSDATLIEENCKAFEETLVVNGLDDAAVETATLLHISIEDTIYKPAVHPHSTQKPFESEKSPAATRNLHEALQQKNAPSTAVNEIADLEENREIESPLYTHIVAHTPVTNTNTNANSAFAGITSSAASKPKILTVVEKRKLKRFAADLAPASGNIEDTQTRNAPTYAPQTDNPFVPVKRQATDSFYAPLKVHTNANDNQYHSLPDINIGQSLKVSECIDAKLRSSYNLQKYQRVEDLDRLVDCQLRESTNEQSTTQLLFEDEQDLAVYRLQEPHTVTKAEIYDSIKRFGRAHQQARQKEYKEYQDEHIELVEQYEQVEFDKQGDKEVERTTTPTEATNLPVEQQEEATRTQVLSEAPAVTTDTTAGCDENSLPEKLPFDNLVEDQTSSRDSSVCEEQPKEAPNEEITNFSRQIERRAKEIKEKAERQRHNLVGTHFESTTCTRTTFRLSKSNKSHKSEPKAETETTTKGKSCKANGRNQFRIIVTDTQNNIIEEKSIESDSTLTSREGKILQPFEEAIQSAPATKAHNVGETSKHLKEIQNFKVTSLKRIPSKTKRQQLHQHTHQQQHQQQNKRANSNSSSHSTAASNYCETLKPTAAAKSKERRVLSTQIYKARPIKVLCANTCDNTLLLRRSGSNSSSRSQLGSSPSTSGKMSRPQILHVVDNSKRGGRAEAPLPSAGKGAIISSAEQQTSNKQVENEYLRKVDAVKCYWSKLAQDEQQQRVEVPENKSEPRKDPTERFEMEPRHFVLGARNERAEGNTAEQPTVRCRQQDDFCSFMPSIEIIELDGDKTATIVSAVPPSADGTDAALANDASEPQFDHIRYKVLKSQQFIRSNILARHKKEAQFDGLIQYLQEYSFQELLSNNNVVIVEPVRTKIERPMTAATVGVGAHIPTTVATKLPTKQAEDCSGDKSKQQASAQPVQSNGAKQGGIRRHFFYQPVRINRELYEEELPDPDTVRNVRKFFEEHILPHPTKGILPKVADSTETEQTEQAIGTQQSPKSRRARKYRYLTIDTSYGHVAAQKNHHHSRKWDTASVSSGISSGDLSSPCEYNEATTKGDEQLELERAKKCANAAGCKMMHVQDVVRRHNTAYETATKPAPLELADNDFLAKTVIATSASSSFATRAQPQPRARPRPRSAIYEPNGDSTYYRDIYGCNAAQNCCAKTASKDEDADADGDDDDEQDGLFADDVDDELCESYYVSNDVLEKIRECGSTVTYYGGRVVNSSSPDLLCGSSNYNGNATNSHYSTMGTLARARAREFETCSVCQPHECPTKGQLEQKYASSNKNNDQQSKEQTLKDKHESMMAANNLKFKLIKSNSCSSRLELAGTGVDVAPQIEPEEEIETEVVRKMVQHFESNKQGNAAAREADNLLTINNQTPVKLADKQPTTIEEHQPVTVNNHINVPVPANRHISPASQATQPSKIGETDVTPAQRTYVSTALDVHLDNDVAGSAANSSTTKICRNKNVDLAFTMAKQQQQQHQQQKNKSSASKDAITQQEGARLPHHNPSDSNNVPQKLHHTILETGAKSAENNSAAAPAAVVAAATAAVDAAAARAISAVTSREFHEHYTVEASQQQVESVHMHTATTTSNTTTTTPPTATARMTTPKPTQIVVPVEIHRVDAGGRQPAQEEKPCLSTTSSMASLVDRTVVRHYVTNDKSLYEKRKYDDIEFEEFEVYDPTKDFEKLVDSAEQQAAQAPQSAQSDGTQKIDKEIDAPFGHTPKGTSDKAHTMASSAGGPPVTNGVDDAERKTESDTDCYDSLNEPL